MCIIWKWLFPCHTLHRWLYGTPLPATQLADTLLQQQLLRLLLKTSLLQSSEVCWMQSRCSLLPSQRYPWVCVAMACLTCVPWLANAPQVWSLTQAQTLISPTRWIRCSGIRPDPHPCPTVHYYSSISSTEWPIRILWTRAGLWVTVHVEFIELKRYYVTKALYSAENLFVVVVCA